MLEERRGGGSEGRAVNNQQARSYTMAKQTISFTIETTGEIAAFFNGSTKERTLTGDRVVELLGSYAKTRSREDGKRADVAIVRELMKSEEMKATIAKMRASLNAK